MLKSLFKYFPSVKPTNVKEKLHNEKIVDDKSKLVVIAFKPKPTDKLSNDTPNAKSIVPNLFNFISLFVGLIYSINISKDKSTRIIPNIKFEFINIILFKEYDINTPISGIIKWNIPTVKLVLIDFFKVRFFNPKTVAIENASILKQQPIINKSISSFILSPY